LEGGRAFLLFLGGDELVCHCFGHTRADIEADALLNGRSLILEALWGAKRMGGCRCPGAQSSSRALTPGPRRE